MTVAGWCCGGDVVGAADVAHRVRVEPQALAGPDAAGVQLVGDLGVRVVVAEACDQVDSLGWWACCVIDTRWPLDRVLLSTPGAPADSNLNVTTLGLARDRDVGDHRAQQPLAVLLGCAVRGPERGHVTRKRFELLARGLRCGRGLLGELGLCLGELAELGLPASLEAAGDEPVLGLADVKRALGTSGVVTGALDAQLKRPVRPRAAVCDLVGRGERDRDPLRPERLEQPTGD